MDKKSFKKLIEEKIIILDGATGTYMQKSGMPKGACPEKWAIENREVLKDVQSKYIEAGSDVIYTFTFGGSRPKLEEYGLGDSVFKINKELAQISRETAGDNKLVAGDLAPTGKFIKPFGDMPFEDAVNIFKEQVKGLLEGGVDFFVIETMMDIQEARAALIAVKESCDLPVCVSMTFGEDGLTLTGTDPATALVTLQSLGADAVGCNCSTGPEAMLEIIRNLKPHAKIPLLAKPNAGLPQLIDGKTVFNMKPQDFGKYVKSFAEAGVNLMGGCCGTSPEYISQISEQLKGCKPVLPKEEQESAVTSARETVQIGFDKPVIVVGERINPTGKKKLQEELREGRTSEVRRFAAEQLEKGAKILDVNVGMPGIDEKETMIKLVDLLTPLVNSPLCIDSSHPEVIEAALRIYPGRALINSISAEKKKLERLLPLAAKYGAMFVLLPLNDEGIPTTAEDRVKVVEQIYETAKSYGFTKKDFVVDGLVMTVSSDQKAAVETLKVIDWCTNKFECATIIGLSNVSFGLPERSWVNSAFFTMAMGRGLTMAIANPSSDMLMNLKMASDVLMCKDANSRDYISHFSQDANKETGPIKKETSAPILERVYDAVLKGDRENIKELLEKALKEGANPGEIVDRHLIPAITQVGELYEKKQYFLPQLIQSAETMKNAFEMLEPLLKTGNEKGTGKKTKVVLATVKGDIHDIGKNIVGLMLKNYGFDVFDLGKDVGAADIVAKAREEEAEIIGLSALMTTTMMEMKDVIELAKREGISSKFMIGGAVINESFAKEIGADGYASDAHAAVKLAKKLSGLE